MQEIDRSKPVLVTGATGYLAGWLVKKLLDQGLTVHAAVRNPDKKSSVEHLDALAKESPGTIKYFKADLLVPGSYAEAMKGCELIFHTASPFVSVVKDPQKELIDPAVKGTENVLTEACRTPSVKRVVLTSSCAAIYTDAIECLNLPNQTLTEEIWNTTASLDYQPYYYSKTLAEKKAWEIANGQTQWDLITINPSLILGPALNAKSITSESYNILLQLGDGTTKPGVPNLGMGLVDVREVAEAHYLAGFTPSASGRYITSGHNTNLLEMAQSLLPKYGDRYPIPKRALPRWLIILVGPLMSKLVTRRFLRNNVNIAWKADNSKIRRDLGIAFRPLAETMNESFQVLIESGKLPQK